mgnify:CR=1 FL=1
MDVSTNGEAAVCRRPVVTAVRHHPEPRVGDPSDVSVGPGMPCGVDRSATVTRPSSVCGS